MCISSSIGFKICITDPYLFYIGRFLTGLGTGGMATVGPVYIAEVAETSIRGALGSAFNLMMVTGMAVVNGLGIENALSWGTITIFSTIPAICTILAMLLMPESPLYLMSKDEETAAFKALVWLRGNSDNVNIELEALKKSCKELRL